MLSQALGGLLPAAVAIALSPIPIVAIVVLLGTPRARTCGPAFAVGWVLGLAGASTLVVVLAHGAHDPNSSTATGVNWLLVALGVLFLGMAAQQWRKRPRPGQEPKVPAWMATLDPVTPPKALGLGLALSAANPKNLALCVAAAASVAEQGLGSADTAIAIAVLVAIGSITVVGAVAAYLVAPTRAAPPLASLKQFMSDHNAVIMMVVLLLLGAKFLCDGLGAL
jgi:threonine/homoserine/homoserine lactone efflux protein